MSPISHLIGLLCTLNGLGACDTGPIPHNCSTNTESYLQNCTHYRKKTMLEIPTCQSKERIRSGNLARKSPSTGRHSHLCVLQCLTTTTCPEDQKSVFYISKGRRSELRHLCLWGETQRTKTKWCLKGREPIVLSHDQANTVLTLTTNDSSFSVTQKKKNKLKTSTQGTGENWLSFTPEKASGQAKQCAMSTRFHDCVYIL